MPVRTSDVRVVVAEGSELNLLPLLLDADGVNVIGAANSTGVLGPIVSRTRPDVVVLDMEMAADAIAAVRAAHPSVSIVVVWPAAVMGIGADVHILPGVGAEELRRAVLRAPRLTRVEELVVIPEAAAVAVLPSPRVVSPPKRRSGTGRLAIAASLALLLLTAGLAGVIGSRGRVARVAAAPPGSIPDSPSSHGGARPPTGTTRPIRPAEGGTIVLTASHASATIQQPAAPSTGSTEGSGGGGSAGSSAGTGSGGGSSATRSHERPRTVRAPDHVVGDGRARRDREHRHPRPADHGGRHHERPAHHERPTHHERPAHHERPKKKEHQKKKEHTRHHG